MSIERTLPCGSYSLAIRNFYSSGKKAADFANSCVTRSARLDKSQMQTNHGVHDRNSSSNRSSSNYPLDYSLVVNLGSSTGFEWLKSSASRFGSNWIDAHSCTAQERILDNVRRYPNNEKYRCTDSSTIPDSTADQATQRFATILEAETKISKIW